MKAANRSHPRLESVLERRDCDERVRDPTLLVLGDARHGYESRGLGVYLRGGSECTLSAKCLICKTLIYKRLHDEITYARLIFLHTQG